MSGPFDSIFKELLLEHPESLLRLLNLPVGDQVTSENTDLSASSRRADILLRVSNPDYLVQIEMQTSYDASMPKRMLEYYVLSSLRYSILPDMECVLLLLRPQADGKLLSGVLRRKNLHFTYHIVRLWELDVETALRQPVEFLPLVPLCAVSDSDLPSVLSRMQARLDESGVSASSRR